MSSIKRFPQKYGVYTLVVIAVIVVLGAILAKEKPQALKLPSTDSKEETYWKEKLSDQAYYVLRQNGTDIPFTSPELLNEKRAGTYVTADCGEPVFRSEQKYDSGTGWPSFYAPIDEDALILKEDTAGGVVRVEVRGKKCNTHLGHVFDDGPEPTGKRYCINASALKFIPDET